LPLSCPATKRAKPPLDRIFRTGASVPVRIKPRALASVQPLFEEVIFEVLSLQPLSPRELIEALSRGQEWIPSSSEGP
jgi:hypothetical protein